MVKPEDLASASEYVKTGSVSNLDNFDLDLSDTEEFVSTPIKMISSSANARERFNEDRKKRFDRTKSAR